MATWLDRARDEKTQAAFRGGLLILAASFAYLGWRALDARPFDLDVALPWYALCITCLIVSVISWRRPRLPRREAIASLAIRHRWEILALVAIVGLALWVRLFEFGDLPPSGGLAYEEAQTGGIAYRIIHGGLRPIEFALTNYTAALGFRLFGYDAAGLRTPFLILSIASVGLFYVLLRQLVSMPAALFASALFALNRWHAFGSGIADETFLGSSVAILAVLLLLVYLRSHNGLALVALGLVTGALNYEYVSYRLVPYLIVGVLIGVALWRAARVPEARKQPSRVIRILVRGWAHAGAFVIALFIAVSPLIVPSLHGDGTYFEAFRRHHGETADTVFFGLLPSDWPTKVKWTAEVFLPFGPDEYTVPLPLGFSGEHLLDPLTGSLALIAMAWCVLTVHKPYRLFFVLWLIPGLFVGGVIPVKFLVPKLTGLLPAMFVCIAFLIDDTTRLLDRRLPAFPRLPGARPLALAVLGLGLLAWAGYVNVDALHRQSNRFDVRVAFADPQYAMCSLASELPDSTDVYLWSELGPTHRLLSGRDDYAWICRGFTGRALNSPSEMWPLEVHDERQAAFVYVDEPLAGGDPVDAALAGYPELALTADQLHFGTYGIRAYTLSAADLRARQGLLATFFEQGNALPGPSRIERPGLFVAGGAMAWPAGAQRVEWSGQLLAREAGRYGLGYEGRYPAVVTVDGQVTYRLQGLRVENNRVDLAAGWHTIEISAARGMIERVPPLQWLNPNGGRTALSPGELFAISLPSAWTHVIEATDRFGSTWQRIDATPAIGSADIWLPVWLARTAQVSSRIRHNLTRDTWRAIWHVPAAGTYDLRLNVSSGTASVRVDGVQVGVIETSPESQVIESISVSVSAGSHPIEIVFVPNGFELAGVEFDGDPPGMFTPH